MYKKIFSVVGMAMLLATSCQTQNEKTKENTMDSTQKGTFAYDMEFLKQRDSIIVLYNSDSSGMVIVSPKYQGKVFTSTAEGLEGKSFGWVNYKAFDEPVNNHMNAYGGEDRMWLGPEGGKYSIYFKSGTEQKYDNWHTPPAIDTEAWNMTAADAKKVSMNKETEIINYAGTPLKMKLERDVEILENASIQQVLNINIAENVNAVGFKTVNKLYNTGDNEWTEQTGAPCIWSLDMFMPSETCVIVIPYLEQASGKVATTDYFGEIDKDRITYNNGVLFFRADGKSRGKLGIPPNRAKNVAGSYDATNNVLTITLFDVYNDRKYLNQEWRTDRDPYSGDAMNAYNDGPLEDGTQMGPFYEIESVSPPAFLKSGENITHNHTVFHFTGDDAGLNEIATKVLGVSLGQIKNTFK